MKKSKHFFKLNNKGASLVTVIIVIGFIGILASVIMTTSLVNYKMKRMNVYAKDTFYSAEQVLDEINVGLQRYVSDSISVAYRDVLQNYSNYSAEKKHTVLQTKYYENMWGKLEADHAHKKYSIDTIESFLKPTTKWQGNDKEGYGAIVRAVDGDGNLTAEGDMITYDTGIILKKLRIYYKDSKGFVSIIETDIRLAYPEFDLTSTTSLPDISSYGVIADNGMELKGVAPLELQGSFYADTLKCDGTGHEGRRGITHTGDGTIIVKHDLQLKNTDLKNDDTSSLWAGDIKLSGANITLLGETNVADDINIGGDGSSVTLGGVYNGFGNSITDSNKSSAILINGTNTSLDLSGIEKITLAGHAYIGTKAKNTQEAGDESASLHNDRDAYTGESIAVKSNQLMYMIPPECIGVDKKTGVSLYNKNPLTTEEYNKIKNDAEHYTEVSADVEVEKLGSTLADYISVVKGQAQPEVVFVPTSTEPLVYYYMKFKNEVAANKYFAAFYNRNKEIYDSYIKNYVKLLEFPKTATVTRIRLSSNGIYGDKDNGYTLLPYTVEGGSTGLSNHQMQYQEQFLALSAKLTKNYRELTDLAEAPDEGKQILFENLIDKDELSAFIKEGGNESNAYRESLRISGDKGDVILTKEENLIVTDSGVHLVISTGNVTINVPDFSGTVFADGTVTVSENVRSIKADKDIVNALLRYFQPIDGKNIMVAQVLRDGKDYAFAIQNETDTDRKTTSLADLIIYENWKKE